MPRPSVSPSPSASARSPAPVAAQVASEVAGTNGRTSPTTPWGDPDLQGIWDYRTLTPLARPEEFAERNVAPEEEAAEYELRANAVRDARTTVHAVWWLDYGRELTSDRRTSLIVDPPEGRIPETTDPETWTRPWTFAMPMTRTDQPTYEYACHEGNYGLRNILHNARYAEDPDYLSKLPSPTTK